MCWWAGGTEMHIRAGCYDSHCVMIWNNVWQWPKATMFPPCDTNRRLKQVNNSGEGVERKCLWTTSPVAWLFLSCHQLLKGELPVLRSPKPSAVSISDDDNDRKPECFLKWLCNPDMDLCGVEVWVSEHPRTWEWERMWMCANGPSSCYRQCTPVLTKALSLCHLTHRKLHRQLVWATIRSI